MKNKKRAIYMAYENALLKEALTFLFPDAKVEAYDFLGDTTFQDEILAHQYEQILFVNYLGRFEEIARDNPQLSCSFLFTPYLSSLSDQGIQSSFLRIMDLLDRGLIKKVAFLDEGLYQVLKKEHQNLFYLPLILPSCSREKEVVSNEIGMMSSEYDPNDNFYNQLSVFSFFKDYTVKIVNPTKKTKDFVKRFHIHMKKCKQEKDCLEHSALNLYVSFTNAVMLKFFRSMDLGIPCLLGNTSLFQNSAILKKYLVVESDDDINEIKEKIQIALDHKEEILTAYVPFRKAYEDTCKEYKDLFIKDES